MRSVWPRSEAERVTEGSPEFRGSRSERTFSELRNQAFFFGFFLAKRSMFR